MVSARVLRRRRAAGRRAERGVPDRLDRSVLGGLSGTAARTGREGDERGRAGTIRRDTVSRAVRAAFRQDPHDPGYIKGYPPGVRENGGQYTHAALLVGDGLRRAGRGRQGGRFFPLLNPINHARHAAESQRYKVEPYVVAADIYASAPHIGRGGWTWYTGSAGWMQRAGIESILGLRLQDGVFHLDPCIPKGWAGYEMTVRTGLARHEITVDNAAGVSRGVTFAEMDGVEIRERPPRMRMVDDGGVHRVRIRLG